MMKFVLALCIIAYARSGVIIKNNPIHEETIEEQTTISEVKVVKQNQTYLGQIKAFFVSLWEDFARFVNKLFLKEKSKSNSETQNIEAEENKASAGNSIFMKRLQDLGHSIMTQFKNFFEMLFGEDTNETNETKTIEKVLTDMGRYFLNQLKKMPKVVENLFGEDFAQHKL